MGKKKKAKQDADSVALAAFKDLEPLICDAKLMAQLATDAIEDCNVPETTVFAVYHVYSLLHALRKRFYAAGWSEEQ